MINNQSLLYSPLNITFHDYVNNNVYNIHLLLYSHAYKSFKQDFERDGITIIKVKELLNIDYLLPSLIVVWYKKDNLILKVRKKLDKYWNNQYILDKKSNDNNKVVVVDEESIYDAVVVKKDFMRNEAKIYSRYTDKYFWIPLSMASNMEELDEYPSTFKKIYDLD